MSRSRIAPVIIVLMLAGARLYDEADATGRVTLVKHFTPADRESGRYQYVPFDVLPGAQRLTISYEYDKANGENTIDLGLFEPGSLEIGTRAFRGYSGGAKTAVTIAEDEATPGYRPGRIPPGRWHLLLGLYRVRGAGVDVAITIETDARAPIRNASAPAAPAAPRARRGPRAPGAPGAPHEPGEPGEPGAPGGPGASSGPVPGAPGRWYLGALHTHTVHSDGTLTPTALMQQFDALGFDFVAITDHNNTTHRREMHAYRAAHPRPLWIAGEEVTTPNGHASVWGLDENEWIDFRVKAGDEAGLSELVGAARRFGALFSLNHPASTCLGCGWEHSVPKDVAAIEISNGRHGEVDAALARWDALLASGHEITGVGSSDWHTAPNPIDVANVRVLAMNLGETAILNAIASGRVIVMNGASWQTPEITAQLGNQLATVGGILRLSGASSIAASIAAADLPGGRVTTVINGAKRGETALDAQGRARWDQPVSPGYIRFELRAADGALVAIANPIRLRR